MADDVLKDTIEVKLYNDTYEFAIPSYLDEIKIGLKSRDMVRAASGDFSNSVDGLDNQTYYLINTAARFEVLLRRSSTEWPWSAGPDGKPIVDFQKWPKDRVGDAMAVGAIFAGELNSFRQRGITDKNAPGTEAVEGQPANS